MAKGKILKEVELEYTDYKTGAKITREQYIKNGLERGELLVKQECGCVVIQDRTADAYIVYCYKHDAASDMHEALAEVVDKAVTLNHLVGEDESRYEQWVHESDTLADAIAWAEQILAKAEGK